MIISDRLRLHDDDHHGIMKFNCTFTYLMLLQPAGTSPLWADHIFLIISCGGSGRLHDICVSLLIKYTSIIH